MNEMSFFRDGLRPARGLHGRSATPSSPSSSLRVSRQDPCVSPEPQDPENGCAAATGGRSLGIEADGPSRRGSQDGGQSSSRTVREQSRAFSPRLRAQRSDVHPRIRVTGFSSGLLRPPSPHSRCALSPGHDPPRDCARTVIPHICHVPASAGRVHRPRAPARSQQTLPVRARRENKSLTWPTKC
jgi:hypothetical protein